jgi:hypothetical protein
MPAGWPRGRSTSRKATLLTSVAAPDQAGVMTTLSASFAAAFLNTS